MYFLNPKLYFPPVTEANEEGIIAFGGDLSPERLLLAYNSGIFPWDEVDDKPLWWCPDPRMVLFLEDFKVSKSLRKTVENNKFTVTFNNIFPKIISNCAKIERKGEISTWISPAFEKAYTNLNDLGHAISVEVWENEKLVGGMYGVDLPHKKIFCGESMFSLISNASKVGLYWLIEKLKAKEYLFIDCQVFSDHLATLGAVEIPRDKFMEFLNC